LEEPNHKLKLQRRKKRKRLTLLKSRSNKLQKIRKLRVRKSQLRVKPLNLLNLRAHQS
jgi:hypothetical protein